MPGVLCTPHLGASTEEAQTNVAVEAAELLIDFFTTGAIQQSVNMSPLDPKTLEELRGYLNVAYRLGLLLAQMDHCPPTACRLRYQGEVADKDTRLLSAAFAAGLLEHAMEEEVNIVNAEVLLRERGHRTGRAERDSDIGDFSSLITAEVVTERADVDRRRHAVRQQHAAAGPRRATAGWRAYLDGILLIFTHRDMPGVIGKVGNVFGKHRVNIAQMSVGRVDARAATPSACSPSTSNPRPRPWPRCWNAPASGPPGWSGCRLRANCPPGWPLVPGVAGPRRAESRGPAAG